jgi:hypothetical protein
MAFHVGKEVLHHILFQVFHFGVYGGMHVGIDGGNIGIDFPHFLLGRREIR